MELVLQFYRSMDITRSDRHYKIYVTYVINIFITNLCLYQGDNRTGDINTICYCLISVFWHWYWVFDPLFLSLCGRSQNKVGWLEMLTVLSKKSTIIIAISGSEITSFISLTRKYLHAETLALLAKPVPLYFPNMKYLK